MSRRKSGIVNVRMVITEEKILSNIDKVQKLINPNSKKQIVQLEDDTYFKDLISIGADCFLKSAGQRLITDDMINVTKRADDVHA